MKPYIETNFLNLKNYKKLFNNYISFGLQVLLGFGITAIIASKLGIIQLGIFTQTYAIIVVLGQLSVLGLNDSILKKISSLKYNESDEKITLNALIATLLNGSIFATILFFCHEIIYSFFKSNLLIESNKYVYLVIFFLTINKVFFAIIQGKRNFNFFAIVNFLRPFFIFIFLLLFIIFDAKIIFSLIFALVEIIIFLIIFFLFKIKNYIKFSNIKYLYIKQHYSFAFKVCFNSFLSESFIRIDIIMIGLLLEDKFVGIYSLAALFFEGIYQFSIVIRNIINPEIAKLYVEKRFKDLIQLIRYSSILSLLLISIISSFLYYLFPYILFFVENEIMIESRELLKYLIIGLFFYSLIIPSENILFQSNNPLGQSLYMISLTLINILINYVMINKFGVKGAAIGTAFVYFLSIIIFNLYIIFLTELKRGIYLNAINLDKE